MEDEKIIDNTYIKVKTLGRGGEGVAYLVEEKNKNLKFVAKIIEQEGKEEEKEYEENEDFKRELEETKRMFNKIKKINCPYVLHCIKEGLGEIKKNDEILKKRQYFIFEYAPKGDLWKIIFLTGGFGERCSKLIFQGILQGVQALHKSGIIHQDLKIDNIVVDNSFNPKICDFGFATDKQGLLTDSKGTRNFICPQKLQGVPYSGEQSDIFSLGHILFLLVLGGNFFKEATKNDDCYKYIFSKDKDNYFEQLKLNLKKLINYQMILKIYIIE